VFLKSFAVPRKIFPQGVQPFVCPRPVKNSVKMRPPPSLIHFFLADQTPIDKINPIKRVLKHRSFLFLAMAALLFTSCAAPKFLSSPTIQYPPFPDQAKKVEDPAKARVYLMRKEKFMSAGVGIQFFGSHSEAAVGPVVNSYAQMRLIGEIGPASYICWEETPRPFTFQKISDDTNSVTTLNLTAGNVYYLRAYIHNGLAKFTTRVDVLNEKDGQSMLKNLRPPDDYRKAKR
jgi:hypothetical protein